MSRRQTARFGFAELLESWVWVSERPAGPAGQLTLQLGGGVQVEVDAADPARVVRVDIELAPLDADLLPIDDAVAASRRDDATRALFGDEARVEVDRTGRGLDFVDAVRQVAFEPLLHRVFTNFFRVATPENKET